MTGRPTEQHAQLCASLTPADIKFLTKRELDVLRGIISGRSNPEMADQLFISVNTVRFHVANILRKLDVSSRVEAAVLAARTLHVD